MDRDNRNYFGNGRSNDNYRQNYSDNNSYGSFSNGERKYFDDSLLKKRHIDPSELEKSQTPAVRPQQNVSRQVQNNNFAVNDFRKSQPKQVSAPSSSYEDYSSNIYDKYTNYNGYSSSSSSSSDVYSDNYQMSAYSGAGYSSDERPLTRSYRYSDTDSFNQAERGTTDMKRSRRDNRDRRVPDDSKGRRKKSKNPYDDDSIDISSGAPKKGNKKKKIIRNVIIALCVLLVLIGGTAFGVVKWYNSNFKDSTGKEFNVNPVEQKQTGIKNIALFGVDSREGTFEGHSDVIMVLSLDLDNGDVKLISILRDSYVEMEGYKNQKITHAYGYGGPELAVNTINQNFDLDIQDYVTVNFESLAAIIDALGGVEIDVNSTEKKNINYHGPYTYDDFKKVTKTGKILLDGEQAVTYARLRYDSDNDRALRQREVLEAVYNNVMSMSATKYPSLIKAMMPYVETSLDFNEILDLAKILTKGITIHQTSVPDEKYEKDLKSGTFNGSWEWRYDTHEAGKRIHSFIYDDDYSSEIKPES